MQQNLLKWVKRFPFILYTVPGYTLIHLRRRLRLRLPSAIESKWRYVASFSSPQVPQVHVSANQYFDIGAVSVTQYAILSTHNTKIMSINYLMFNLSILCSHICELECSYMSLLWHTHACSTFIEHFPIFHCKHSKRCEGKATDSQRKIQTLRLHSPPPPHPPTHDVIVMFLGW